MANENKTDNSQKPPIKLGFFRGADFSVSIGASDWRIGLYFSDYGFKTWIFGIGHTIPLSKPGVQFILVKRWLWLPLVDTLKLTWAYTREAVRLKLDVIVLSPGIGFAAVLCKIFYPQTKIILDVRSIPVETRGLFGFLQKFYFDAVLKVKSFDALSIITPEMLDDLNPHYHFKERLPIVIWKSGFDHEVFQPIRGSSIVRQTYGLQNKFVIIYHGSFSPLRGIDQLIRSIRVLLDKGMDDVRLVLLGDGPAKMALVNLVTELGLEPQVLFLPPVPHAEVPKMIAAADLGVSPLPNHPWWRHQSPLKVMEYLGMGKPVLAVDLPCHHDLSAAVILLPDNEPATLAQAVSQMRSLPSVEWSRLGELAFQDASRHTWQARAEVLANFIKNELLADNR